MPGEAIERVHALAQRNPAGRNVEFGWRDGTIIKDDLNNQMTSTMKATNHILRIPAATIVTMIAASTLLNLHTLQ